jgi:single-stranded-DNA-specific exonuclease
MPLVGENRVLEKYGLVVLNKTRRPGLKKLIEVSGLKNGAVDTWNIGFQLGPRINASGRIGHANDSLNLLIEEDEIAASMLAGNLDGQNRMRQKASDELYKSARAQANTENKLIVACGDGWHLGLVGLVAGKLLSEYGRPVFVVAKHGDKFTGSGRSIPGFDLTRALEKVSRYLHKFGGHPQACGFTAVGEENFKAAMDAVLCAANEEITNEHLVPKLNVDIEMKLKDINMELVEELDLLAPFGVGNPQPIFASHRARITNIFSVGNDGAHLKIRLCDESGGATQDAIGFGLGHLLEELAAGDIIDVAYEIGVNEWNGRRTAQLKIVDIKK